MNDPASANGFGRDKVVKIISSVLSKVSEAEEISRESLYKDLKDLQDIIHDARKEISFARPSDIQDKHIPTATDELDLIVKSTEEATSSIMDSCEILEQEADKEGGPSAFVVSEEVTKIYEACSFQDLTGQRVTKVISSLVTIEEKVSKMIDILGSRLPGMDVPEEEEATGDAALMNGPQAPDKAISQDDIDKLLAEFD
ncbi:MAG: protein phosphatase CheZ [Pseudomonadota bacterium]|jgi:chemotaxis protein CheZ|nr:protein phosphatase CheZ [Pseudomonadota bacterium]